MKNSNEQEIFEKIYRAFMYEQQLDWNCLILNATN